MTNMCKHRSEQDTIDPQGDGPKAVTHACDADSQSGSALSSIALCISALGMPCYIARLWIPKRNKARMPQMIVRSPLHIFELTHEPWF